MKKYKRLSRQERYYIYVWHYEQKMSLNQIAIRLERTPKTIYDEVKNNRRRPDIPLEKFPYEPEYANWLAAQKRIARRAGKIQTKRGTLKRIAKAIKEKHWTIPMIAHKVKYAPTEATLYRYLKLGINELNDYPKRKYRVKGPSLRSMMRSNYESDFMKAHAIDHRPDVINRRQNYGHWEMDCIDSSKGVKAALLVFLERKTRYVEITKISDKSSQQMRLATEQFLDRHPDEVHSLTADRGHEFTNFDMMSLLDDRKIKIYFTHPYSPSEKGSIERINRDIRGFFPKGKSFNRVTPAEIKQVQDIINHYPRRVIGWESPLFKYRQWQQAQGHKQKKLRINLG